MASSIQRVRSQFNSRPLFQDDAIAHELQLYENRQRAAEMQKRQDAAREHKERLLSMARAARTQPDGTSGVSNYDQVNDLTAINNVTGDPLTPYRALAIRKANMGEFDNSTDGTLQDKQAASFTVPPPVPRPWSVDKLLKISSEVSRRSVGGPGVHATPMGQRTRQQQFAGARPIGYADEEEAHEAEVAHKYMDAISQSLPEEPYWEAVGKDRANRRRWRKQNNAVARRHVRQGGERDVNETDDDHDYHYNQAYYMSQGAMPARGTTRTANLTDASSLRTYDRDEMVFLNGEDSDRGSSIFDYDSETAKLGASPSSAKNKKGGGGGGGANQQREIPAALMEAHIERAAARKALQESRLLAMGVRAPNARIEMATQADIKTGRGDDGLNDDAAVLGGGSSPNNENTGGSASPHNGRERSPQNDLSRHVGSLKGNAAKQQLVGRQEGLILEPQLPIHQSRPFQPAISTNTDTVWQRVLQEEKQAASAQERKTMREFGMYGQDKATYGIDLYNNPSQQKHDANGNLIPTKAPYQLPDISNTWLGIVNSSANAEGFRPRGYEQQVAARKQDAAAMQHQQQVGGPNGGGRGGVGGGAGWPSPPNKQRGVSQSQQPHHPSFPLGGGGGGGAYALSSDPLLVNATVPSSAPSKDALLRRIDQMQLANEELLIRNKVINDPMPSSAGGAFAVNKTNHTLMQNPDERMSHAAVSHVAAAYSDSTAQAEALSKFRPVGGYGSVTDPSYNPRTAADNARWVDARIDNERQQMRNTETEPLRTWATNLPTNFIGNLANDEAGPAMNNVVKAGQNRSRAGGGVENAARRKWGDVTFANHSQHPVGQGVVENLSMKARQAMFPDAAFN